MKKFVAAMTLVGALAPALFALPAKAGDCDGCSYSTRHISVSYKPVIYRTVTYRPVISTHVYLKKVYHTFFRRHYDHCCCYCCNTVSAYPDAYVFTYY